MIHFGGLPPVVRVHPAGPRRSSARYLPCSFRSAVGALYTQLGSWRSVLAPLFWAALEWLRLETTGQLWNALGYSQAFHPALIQSARWGGVYAIGFLIVAVNAAIAFALLKRNLKLR